MQMIEMTIIATSKLFTWVCNGGNSICRLRWTAM
jgi:hypothetical protein